MKVEIVKYGLIFGFFVEKNNWVLFLGPILITKHHG